MPPAPSIPASRAPARAPRRIYLGPTCPCCAAPLPRPVPTGTFVCRRCQHQITAAAFTPPTDPGPVVLEAGHQTPCARHARNLAVGSCDRCGAFMCTLCQIDIDGRALCSACFERLEKAGELPSTRPSVRNWNGIAFHLSLLGLICCGWFIGILWGPAVILLAARGRRQNQRLGDDISVVAGNIAVVLGILETLAGIAVVLALLGVFNGSTHGARELR